MFGRICVFAAICAAAVLAAFLSPEQADARSSVAATAAHHCSRITAATRHRNSDVRVLSSADAGKAHRLCGEVRSHLGTIRFWHNPKRQWTLYSNHPHSTCWDLRRQHLLEGPQELCMIARGAVRISTRKLTHLDVKIKALLPKPQPRSHLVHDWLFDDFVCIHDGHLNGARVGSGEGAWNAVATYDGTTYYGGLQMDATFQGQYGADFVRRWGTADKWPPWAQIQAAERAYRSGRGFYPWPNTAHACKLI